MSLMDSLLTGKAAEPPKLIIAGPEKSGKSTTAAQAPNNVFIPTEEGLNQIGPTRFPIADAYDEVIQNIGKVIEAEHNFEWLVIDTLDCLQKLLFQHIALSKNKDSIEDFGYSKGYIFAAEEFKNFLQGIDCVRHQRKMGVIFVCQVDTVKVNDPDKESYNRLDLRLHKKISDQCREWADAILFTDRKMVMADVGSGFNERKIAKGIGKEPGGDRIFRCIGSPACAAGNRYGMPETLPLSWSAIEPFFFQGE